MDDYLVGPSTITVGMREFYDCVQHNQLSDVKSHGLHFTWNQKPKNGVGVLKKIDRVMSNTQLLDLFPDAYVLYQPYRVSDHSPCILNLFPVNYNRPKPFKFANFLARKEGFIPCVAKEWVKEIPGKTMFSVVKKLTALKSPLRRLLFYQGNLHNRVKEVRLQLDVIQKAIDDNPLDLVLRESEARCIQEFNTVSYDEECFLKQKAKTEWLAAGDSNTKFFHNCVKMRNACNKIHTIQDVHGNWSHGNDVFSVLVAHYSNFLGTQDHVSKLVNDDLFSTVLDSNGASNMVRQVTREEIKSAMFSIGENKAPGPDGYTSAFFKNSWEIVGEEITKAILDFFDNGKLLQQINHTIIALVPKTQSPNSVTDYRPISCCNVLYKCISKIITERIKGSLDRLVDINQSAFVSGRKITDNILLTQELMHNYHLDIGPPRCAFKIDIQKAYDTVSWSFLEDVLHAFGFHPKMVKWIMVCVTSVSYLLSINGNLYGYFKGKRGLRQGDPISPYLFTLVMEVLSLLLKRAANSNNAFRFHLHCKKQKIINVSFADDLFLFANGDAASVRILRDTLKMFSSASGLVPSLPKSTVYFGNVPRNIKQEILNIMPFQEGSLPVRYLGVPLISTKLYYKDCKVLVDKMVKKIDNWMTRSLSFAGRLQLVTSVLSAMHTYWATVFMLPAKIVHDLERCMRGFLWAGSTQQSVKAKVAWKVVCLPKYEGGLGIRCISDVNKALLSSHVWSVLTNRKSLWVQWIHMYKLKGKSFWEFPSRGRMTWGWRKLLAIRSLLRPFLWSSIGNGARTNVWSDMWCDHGPLSRFISPRRIANAGFHLQSTVADLVSQNGEWTWPIAWYDLFPVLINVQVPKFSDRQDRMVWKDLDGNSCHFSSREVWNNIRHRENIVPWVNMVWFKQCIPRHSFHMWLVIRNKLKTQDRLSVWEAGSASNLNLMCCPLCCYDRDSRNHLFFECSFALEVWNNVKAWTAMESVNGSWDDIMAWMTQHSNMQVPENIISRLVLSAASYFVWQERNNRLFSNNHRTPMVIAREVVRTVRLRMLSFQFKWRPGLRRLLEKWEIPGGNLEIDPG
ncbi:uncharacterized protein LOC110943154 [Helianthus annuus]|uniref:uncharacterized protein LOC110943154 n=1 Tax=Helianthus annuus TaxID=4232 RepID=UPI000B8FD704|nr:uncharacterized protein LOC110943154 [Helianthus annuus]